MVVTVWPGPGRQIVEEVADGAVDVALEQEVGVVGVGVDHHEAGVVQPVE